MGYKKLFVERGHVSRKCNLQRSKKPIVGIHLSNTVYLTWMMTDDTPRYSVGNGTDML